MSNQKEILVQVREALAAGIRNTLEAFRREHPDEHVYGIKFILGQTEAYLGPTFATEEGLTRVAQRYAKLGYSAREGDTMETLRCFLRWANPDDGWYFVGPEARISEAERLVEEAAQNKVIRSAKATLDKLALEVLRSLSEEGAFRTGEAGKEIVVNLTYQDEDDKTSLAWAKKANAPDVYARFQKEMEAGRHASYHQVKSPYDKA